MRILSVATTASITIGISIFATDGIVECGGVQFTLALSRGKRTMEKTPLELLKERENRIDYCDECEHYIPWRRVACCEVSGKLLHPIWVMRCGGHGPAYWCKNAVRRVDDG